MALTELDVLTDATNLQNVFGLALSGTDLFVITADAPGDGLTSVDASDPTNMAVISHITVSAPRGVCIKGSTAWLGLHGGTLQGVDISNPASMSLTGAVVIDATASAHSVAADPMLDYVYVATISPAAFYVVDVSNPAAPSVVGSFTHANLNTGTVGTNRRMAVSGNLVFQCNEPNDRLNVISVATKSAPSLSGSVQDATNLAGPIACDVIDSTYVAVGAVSTDRLTIVDVSTPSSPSVSGSVTAATLNGAGDLIVVAERAYVCAQVASDLAVVLLTPPGTPTVESSLGTTVTRGMASYGSYLFVGTATGNGVRSFDGVVRPSTGGWTAGIMRRRRNPVLR